MQSLLKVIPSTFYIRWHLIPHICSWKGNKTRQNNASKITILGIFFQEKKKKMTNYY